MLTSVKPVKPPHNFAYPVQIPPLTEYLQLQLPMNAHVYQDIMIIQQIQVQKFVKCVMSDVITVLIAHKLVHLVELLQIEYLLLILLNNVPVYQDFMTIFQQTALEHVMPVM